ncbi:MAG: 50S ribosomal protein L9 [Methylococcales bacterium]|jgi:large subunit ribosomal protein L9|nr:50S ribosomal protein L9 [Methylococcales bacterium]MBT7442928.1 50S ribosomal protein L9 [Methylococcales bacterium]
MEVILLRKVQNLGDLGDKVVVRSGYARNFLVPQGMATRATKENIANFESRKAELQKQAAELLKEAEVKQADISKLEITITRNAGDEGKLFGSVGTSDIAEAITEAGVAIEKKDIRLPEGALRTIGEHAVTVHLHTDINVEINVNVAAEE